jgi:pyrimidine oxygenase
MADVPGTGGVLLTFDDFLEGVEMFGTRIQPMMKSRAVEVGGYGCADLHMPHNHNLRSS